MGLSENSDDHIFKRYQELSNNLNMDSTTTAQAWDSYESISQHYTLEGDPLHWLGCAVYVACRKSTAPTVGQTGSIVNGNCVSLTQLLRLCKFSLTQFFAKSKKWADMANMPSEFRERINRLERNFGVSCIVFKKYHTIFNEIFQTPIDDQPKQHRSRKQRNLPCTPARIFEFCWTLFVCIKGEYARCSDDLVVSFHLLLACCDMAFSNAFLADRRDLLNANFSGLPENWSSLDYVKPTTVPCILDNLCKRFDGIVLDAKWVKEYSWKNAITKLFEKGVLQGDTSMLTGLFDAANFDSNMRAVNKVYEEHVLNVGEFDEKIFLAEYRRTQLINKQAAFGGVRSALRNLNTDPELNAAIGSPKNIPDGQTPIKRNLSNQYEDQIQQLFPATPLTGRKYLRDNRDAQRNLQITSITQSVIRLQTMLSGRKPEPSPELKEIFSSCSTDPSETIKARIKELGEKFRIAYTQQNPDQAQGNIDFVNQKLTLSEILFYKLLENIAQEEKLRKPNLDMMMFLDQDIFHRCMFACSIEIVICSYNCQKKFPWILQALELKAYYFYRVIELIVRTKDQLSRDVVKHLSSIEEQILDSMAWESDSPLWQCIEESNRPVPSCEDTALPGQLDDGSHTASNPSIKKIQTPNSLQSPVATVSDRFQSPVANSLAKKKLFGDSQLTKIQPGRSVLQNSTSKAVALLVVDQTGQKKLLPLPDFNITEATTATTNVITSTGTPTPMVTSPSASTAAAAAAAAGVTDQQQSQTILPKPKRNGSLALFFRKFYNLAGVRMEDLCQHLNITDLELKRKIFTCFEHCIITNTSLMKDRHLDQILMCSTYVVCRVTGNDKTFTDIMRCYRFQPQSDSHIYRSVLLKKNNKRDSESDDENAKSSSKNNLNKSNNNETVVKKNPSELTGTSTSHESEERGDLIKFYNTVYIQCIKEFALRFSKADQVQKLHLSPLPATKHLVPTSPKRRVTENIYIRPYDQINSPNRVKQYSYYFSRSPSKDLEQINTAINKRVGKRLLTDEGEDVDVVPIKKSAPTMTRRLQGLIEDRLVQSKD